MKSSLLRMSFVLHPSIHVLSEIGRMDDWMKGTHAGKPTFEFMVFPIAHSDEMILMSVRFTLVENEKWFFI